jgi:hypothetical protein
MSRTSEPSAAMVKMSALPIRSDSKAIRPSGATRGSRSAAGDDAVRFTGATGVWTACRYTSQPPSCLLA